ncbi:unnamed protein product [Pedinophyceae sp. YPF-701]|nr:unnamed protein product [Pedinophyceae sp. YPF-701]
MLHDTGAAEAPARPQESIGADYGEGFVEFRPSGDFQLDVEELNRRLRVMGAERLRHSMHPHEAYGVIVDWEDVIVDRRTIQRATWARLADSLGKKLPAIERPIYDIPVERALTDVLMWTKDWAEARSWAFEFAHLYSEALLAAAEPRPGVVEWLRNLAKNNVGVAVVSQLDRHTLVGCLNRMGLEEMVRSVVAEEDGADTWAHRYLAASVKLSRPPSGCVVFSGDPLGIAAAHNCTMKAVGVAGGHAHRQDLLQADVTTTDLSTLTVFNLRRLFSEQGSEFMDPKVEFSEDKPVAKSAIGTLDV